MAAGLLQKCGIGGEQLGYRLITGSHAGGK
jgi:hypothetical protein